MIDKFTARNRLITRDNLAIFYFIDYPTNAKKTFQVLHPGASMNHTSLIPLADEFVKSGYPVLVVEPRGVGHSDKPNKRQSYDLPRYSEDLEDIIKKEGIEKPDLLGHSAGFMPEVDYAVKAKNASRIVGISTSYCFAESYANKNMLWVYDNLLRYCEYLGSMVGTLRHLIRGEKRPYSDQSDMAKYGALRTFLQIVDVPFEEINAHIISGKNILKWGIKPQLQKLNRPALLIQGKNDQFLGKETGSYIQRLGSENFVLRYLPGDHTLPLKNPKLVSETIRRWYRN